MEGNVHPGGTRTEGVVTPRSIVILDCGGQYAHLIANRVRRLGAYSEIRIAGTPADQLKDAAGIILSGGPQSVYEKGSPQADPAILTLGIPVLGLCYGHQWIAHTLKGEVTPGKVKEYGKAELEVTHHDELLFKEVPKFSTVWMSHGDEVSKLPDGFIQTGKTTTCENAAFADAKRKIFGCQFHMEVTHSEHGMRMLRNFVGLCDHAPWQIKDFVAHVSDQILREVGDKKVFMLVSGGVDSTVAFTLLNKVLGADRVQGLLVDTGLMRKDEVKQIQEAFAALGVKNLRAEDASEEFFTALEGVFEPEEKRKRIGDTFLAVQKRVSEEMHLSINDGWMLGQGTIYPDTIETGGTKHADHIKTHHNRVSAIQEMIEKGLIIEPLRELYKDEVRMLGEQLGLPHDLVWRHPFPGPGLGVRILCAADSNPVSVIDPEIQTRIDSMIPKLHMALPIRSVGVQGNGRTYRHAVSLFSHHPTVITPDHLDLATSIPNAIPVYNRVLLCTSHETPPEIVFTPGYLTRGRADLLREANQIVTDEMHAAELYEKIWQFPVVLLPFGTSPGGQSIVLRPISSQDAMTANAFVLPEPVLDQMTRRLKDLPGIDMVFFDLTNKPPATIEWE
jgi:GMP synthase (glutamine-hydrolysing)